ncbi:protein Njmu-R1-like isoform X2 [Pomacea canaliculata]|uniref:protein Njmu-R1-like isoform X2 n=1 Tax=Pomacea canaliculata TaxID=400727 RepID=UPI000D72BEF5|nr:protein Njmu-R1-like isoform X2 [Pomacea canaliculata]
MADKADTSTTQNSTGDQPSEKKQSDIKRYYALYTFYPNRPKSISDPSSIEEETSEDGNLSLSIAATNLSASAETDLRKSLAQRLSRLPSPSGQGHFLPVGISSTDDVASAAACYFCVLKLPSDSESDADKSNNLRRFVVCFVSFTDSSLDLFRQDLDKYSEGFVQYLDEEHLPMDSPQSGDIHWQLSQVNTGLKKYLEAWPETVLEYLTRCITRLGQNVQYLVYSALVDASLQVCDATAEEEDDIRKFISCCSLSPLLEQLQASDQLKAGISPSGEAWQVQPDVITLKLKEQEAVFDMQGVLPCHFCKIAADHLLSIEAQNVTKIRDTLESVKLAFIHNLNKLKRFLKEAEVDHYALYRAYVFLKKCGCGNLLLRYVKLDASLETSGVLAAIEHFIKEKGVVLT